MLSRTAAHEHVEEPDWWLELKDFHDELDAAARHERPDFVCPVTNEIMRVPYLLVDGNESLHPYEYNVLVSWFITEGNDTDPIRNTSRHAAISSATVLGTRYPQLV